jgi:regulator of sigma E protease
MTIILSIIYFIIVLGILVFVHEGGHFLMARLCGMRVDTFAIGMGFRLFGYNKITGFTFGKLPENVELNGHTDYRLSAFPVGGYCSIAGMVDETTLNSDQLSSEPEEWEFRAKGPIKKALAISGGVLMNIVLAIIFFGIVIFNNGESTYKTTQVGGVSPNSIASALKFQSGDKILSINNQIPTNWSEMIQMLAIDNMGNDVNIRVLRNGDTLNLFADGKELTNQIASNVPFGLEPIGVKTVVMEVIGDGLAKQAGIVANDTMVAVNGTQVFSNADFISQLKNHKGQSIIISVKNTDGITDKQFQLDSSGTIGVQIASVFTGDIQIIKYGFFESIIKGAEQTYETAKTIVVSIWQIIVGNLEFKKAIGGPIMIAQQATQFAERGLISFMSFTAMLSVSLALINILPFPGLDGGHLLTIIIEAIIRRELPIKVKLIIQQAGLLILFALMIYVIFNDIQRLI